MGGKQKMEMSLSKKQTCDFLRKLADSLEAGEDTVPDYDVDLKNYGKLKLSLKPKYEQIKLKVDLKKYIQEEDEETEEYEEMKGKEKYKKLKKRMESYFKEINESLSNGYFPSKEIVSVFLKDSETMCTYEGKGDEFYQEYKKACANLQETIEKEDLQAFRGVFEQVSDIKERCHAKFK